MIGRYQSVRAFRAALEERLKQIAREQGLDLMRLRRQVAFDRLLARLFSQPDPPWLLKGGYALELRMGNYARATKDIDLSIPMGAWPGREISSQTPAQHALIREKVQDAFDQDLHDGFVFHIGEPMAELDGAPYGGVRYPIAARLDARIFASFHMDIDVGDALVAAPEWLIVHDLLGFAGISPARIAVITQEQQFAEKIHAYTFPRGEHMNTRVKDLLDLVLLLHLGPLDTERTAQAIRITFAHRATHDIPAIIEAPPRQWREPYRVLAAASGLADGDIDKAHHAIVEYWASLKHDHA